MSNFVTTLVNERRLLAQGENLETAWLDVSDKPFLVLARSMEGASATYRLTAFWSNTPAGAVIFTNDYTLNDVSAGDSNIRTVSTMAPFVKFRVTNAGSGAFTSHTLHIGARGQA